MPRCPSPLLLALALAAPAASAADEAPGPTPGEANSAPTAPTEAPPPDLSPRAAAGELDFSLLAPSAAAGQEDPAFAAKVALRRERLRLHQGAGLATWALMGLTVAVGQLNYHDLYGGGGYTERYRTAHRSLAFTTAGAFAATGVLALTAPVPYEKKLRLDAPLVHRGAMATATAGVIAQVVLGVLAHGALGALRQRDLAAAHLVVGYATFGAMSVGALSLAL